ncbi:MAG: DEAD/DEAH box helicase [Bacteroidaceae bacterium]|nr:DEAD/DEAH box helicase [Bacteroidaceae bacterium]
MESNNRNTKQRLSNTIKPAEMGLEEWQVALRRQQAQRERFIISELGAPFSPGEYQVRNPKSRSQYKVIYRGAYSPWNYCSCPDFRTSGLGTCKHVEGVKLWLQAEGKEVHNEEPDYTSIYMDYRGERCIRIRFGEAHRKELATIAKDYFDQANVLRPEAYAYFDSFLEKARGIDPSFRCYPDALEEVISQRERLQRAALAEDTYTDETLDNLLSAKLYPYQKEGVRFAFKAGKAIIADEMGLGKTVQAICLAEIYLREKMAESMLIVCPNSLKYQWKSEIERWTGRNEVLIVEGYASRRLELYKATTPYKIVSYQSLANDIKALGRLSTDLLIMDEVQRLKNWNTQLAWAVRRIDAHYNVLLSGTPLENNLDELVSIVQLADPYCLSPLYRFRYDHIITDPESGKAVGYKNLNDIKNKLKDTLIRRTKQSVQLQLPKRTDQFLLIPMTPEQSSRHEELRAAVARLVSKWTRTHNLSEEERRRLLLMLGQMRMLADSTFILDQDQESRHDVKVGEVMNILEDALSGGTAKVVIFSEWERMARLVASELDTRSIPHQFLHGGVPAKKREELIETFTNDPDQRIFLSTDAGSTGLNLQVASILINLDLPWNPAILEQRIGRIYRIGQETPIQVLSLVSKDSIEESMIDRLRFKHSMFEGALDGGDDTIFLSEDRFKGFMESLAPALSEREKEEEQGARSKEQENTFGIQNQSSCPSPLAPSPEITTFLTSLRDILQSPEKTKQLAEAITQILSISSDSSHEGKEKDNCEL